MPALRSPRALLRVLVLVGAAALLSGCRIDTSVDVSVGADGSGQVQVNAGFDDEALSRAGDLRLDDVRAAGWTVTGPQKEPDRDASGLLWIHASKAFGNGEQFAAVMNEITGTNGIFRDFRLQRTTGFAKVTYTVTGTIDTSRGLESFSDPELGGLLGGNPLGRPTADLQSDAANASLMVGIQLPQSVKGSADQVDGRRAQWNVALGRGPIPVDVRSVDVQSAARRWAAIAAALALAALAAGVVAILRRSPRRMDSNVRTLTPAPAPAMPMPAARALPAPAPVADPPPVSGAARPTAQRRIQVVVLDAMGVLYREADDVESVLIPFVHEHGGIDDALVIRARYVDATLGRHTTSELWSLIGVAGDPAELDRAYVERFALSDGVREFLDAMDRREIAVACLTNDVAEWSALLRRRFELEARVRPWIVSGEVGARKPDDEIFSALQSTLDVSFRACLLVDDRIDNLTAGRKRGMATVHFAPQPVEGSPYRRVGSLFELFNRGRVNR